MLLLPGLVTRGTANPVIANGTTGSWDDLKVGPACVIKIADGDYRMWYEGIKDNAITNDPVRPGLATSANGDSWTKYGSNPLTVGTIPSWMNDEVSPGTVIQNPDGTFTMWGHGGNNSGPRQAFRATSSDGYTWAIDSSPVVANGGAGSVDEAMVADIKVIRVSVNDYRMWYVGRAAGNIPRVCYATSPDGITWTKYGSNPIFAPGTSGQWDDGYLYVFMPVMESLTEWHAWYISDDASNNFAMGYAYSSDGIAWTRGPYNPVLKSKVQPPANGEVVTDSLWVYPDGTDYRFLYGYYNLGGASAVRGKGSARISKINTQVPPVTEVVDSFPTDGGPPPAGWSQGVISFGASDGLVVTGGQLTKKATGGFRQGGYYNSRTFGDGYLIFDVAAVGYTGFPGFTFYGRLQQVAASTTDGYAVDYDASLKNLTLWRVDNAATPALTESLQVTFAAGDKIAFGLFGSELTAWHLPSGGSMWYRLLRTVDATYPGPGFVGVEFTDAQLFKFDNLSFAVSVAAFDLAGFPLNPATFAPGFVFAPSETLPAEAANGTTPVSAVLVVVLESLQDIAATAATAAEETAATVTQSSSVVIDETAGVAAVAVDAINASAGVAAAAVEVITASGGIAGPAAVPLETVGSVAQTGSAPLEATTGVAATAAEPLNASGGVAASQTAPIEAAAGVASTASEPVDELGQTSVTATASFPIDELQALVQAAAYAAEAGQGATSSAGIAIEATAGVAAAAADILEALNAVAASAADPVESIGLAAISATGLFPITASGGVAASAFQSADIVQPLSSLVAEFVEAQRPASATFAFVIDQQKGVTATAGSQADVIATAAALAGFPIDTVIPAGLLQPGTVVLVERGGVTVVIYEAAGGSLAVSEPLAGAGLAVKDGL